MCPPHPDPFSFFFMQLSVNNGQIIGKSPPPARLGNLGSVTALRTVLLPTCWHGNVFQRVHGFPGVGSTVGAVFPGALTTLTVRYRGGGTQRVTAVTGPVLYASIRITVKSNVRKKR